MEFTSDPFCVTCEAYNGVLICFNNERCEQHQREFEEMKNSEWFKELTRLMEGEG